VELLVEIRDLLRAQQGREPGPDPAGSGTTALHGRL
jgi:large conductance mechanosensitive channel